ncbi:hypothetical protein [Imbroritus primus]|jgi:hypothetical protein|uniref:hypothetical protein n=1 Tax=Imbroritus primus TaxID=3058603 RepID=UPI0002696E54
MKKASEATQPLESDVIRPLSQEQLDAIFQPQVSSDSEAVNVGRSYYGGEWDKKKK